MIPPDLYPECASPGEREIFARLKGSADTRDWIVLHSLEIARHRRKTSGEADFIIIVPRIGVLCLEVKACARIARRDGAWYYGSDNKPDPRGPFKQASEAMHSVRRRIIERRPDLNRVLFWSAVIFPYLSFDESSVEWHAWQVIDNRTLRSCSLSQSLLDVLGHARGHVRSKLGVGWFVEESGEPHPEQCEAIANLLRSDFEYFESPNDQIARSAVELRRYTLEQTIALDAMETNPRTVFAGPAGTGKTLLAVEAARRARASGKRVLLLCFNRLLGKWLEEQTSSMRPSVVASTLHRHMLTTAELAPKSDSKEFWETELPNKAIDRILQMEGSWEMFDALIVDEAQDILKAPYLDYLDLVLKGGLSSGYWRIFGDFEKQAIYGNPDMDLPSFARTKGGNAPIYSLRTNCRNTPRIVGLTHLLGGLSPEYTRVLRPDNHIEPDLKYFASEADQPGLLTQCLQTLLREGVDSRDIMLLSRRSDDTCAASRLKPELIGRRVRPVQSAAGDDIRYCSIHAFKGLESPVVIVTDIDHIDQAESASLFYVGITRALHRLTIVLHESAKEDVLRILTTPKKPAIHQNAR